MTPPQAGREAMAMARDYFNCTLCYIENDRDEYLMLHRVKKKNDVNQDKWIGVGGKFEEGESPEECLLREVWEETGYTLTSYRLRWIVTFQADPWPAEYMFLYTADGYTGTQKECSEGDLQWVPLRKWFNTSGLAYKALGLKDRLPEMDEEAQLRLLSTDGMLVKRPLLIGERFVLVGFREEQWQAALLG